ncbi:MAG: TolB-like translocation protein, partial [Planctomycetota bacterium]
MSTNPENMAGPSKTPVGFSLGAILTLAAVAPSQAAPAKSNTRRVEASFPEVSIESCYVKKGTWQGTLRASIRKLVKDNPTFSLGRCTLNDRWFRSGPYEAPAGRKPADTDLGIPLTGVDLKAKGPDGKRLWEYKGPIRNDVPYDLELPERSSVLQCRQFRCDSAGPMDVYVSSEVPLVMWHNGKQICEIKSGQTDLWKPRSIRLQVHKGHNEIIMRFDNDGDSGSTRYFVKFNNITGLWQRLIERLQQEVARDFTSPRDVFQQRSDFNKRLWLKPWTIDDEAKGSAEFAMRYAKAVGDAGYRKVFENAARDARTHGDVRAIRAAYYQHRLSGTLEARANLKALRRAIADMENARAKSKRTDAKAYLARVAGLEKSFAALREDTLRIGTLPGVSVEDVKSAKPMTDDGFERIDSVVDELVALKRDVMLSNPAIDFERVLLIKRHSRNLGLPSNWLGSGAIGGHLDDELVTMNLLDAEAKLETAFKPKGRETIADVDLNWDGERVLYSAVSRETRAWQIFEIVVDPVTGRVVKGPRQLTPRMGDGVKNYDACYLPDDRVLFCSTAVKQGVPCLAGAGEIANLYLLSADGRTVRQLCFDQDHNWNPTV